MIQKALPPMNITPEIQKRWNECRELHKDLNAICIPEVVGNTGEDSLKPTGEILVYHENEICNDTVAKKFIKASNHKGEWFKNFFIISAILGVIWVSVLLLISNYVSPTYDPLAPLTFVDWLLMIWTIGVGGLFVVIALFIYPARKIRRDIFEEICIPEPSAMVFARRTFMNVRGIAKANRRFKGEVIEINKWTNPLLLIENAYDALTKDGNLTSEDINTEIKKNESSVLEFLFGNKEVK